LASSAGICFTPKPSASETEHRIRLACGNGLAPEIWDAFKDRFRIPQILEFYAATEGSVSLFNVQGKRGAIGHIPAYLTHRFSPALVVFDVETGEPARNEQGFCIRCAPNQVGEALGKVVNDPSNVGSRFEGYTSGGFREEDPARRLRARRRLVPHRRPDAERREGLLLLRRSHRRHVSQEGRECCYFEVSEAICAFPGVQHANVYGVAVPGVEGRVGHGDAGYSRKIWIWPDFRKHLARLSSAYARPVFLRIRNQVDVTGTFKYSKTELIRQGYDPDQCGRALL
jgi:fatty-acyl-CoA synthase